jgi:hypothetical protein
VHDNNLFHGKRFSATYLFKRDLSIYRLFRFFKDRFKYEEDIVEYLVGEYRSGELKNVQKLRLYLEIVLVSNLSFLLKSKKIIRLMQIHFTEWAKK